MTRPNTASSRARQGQPAPPTRAAGSDVETPRWPAAWAALIYTALVLTLGYPALGGQFLVSPISDQYIGGYPVREFAAHMLRTTGHFPLWNPYIFGGMPYVASMNGDMFYPTFILRLLLPTDVAMTWGFIVHIVLAGLFTYCFLRAWGLGFLPSLLGGAAYMMGGPISSYVSPGHDGKLFVSALLPLALWMLSRGMRDGRRWAWGGLAVTIGLAVLSPHPQLLQYMLLTCGAFSLWMAFGGGERSVKLERPVALKRLALAAASVSIGMLMGAVQYLPVIEYVPWSPRAGGLRAWEQATSYSFPPEELINTYLPQFSGILDAYWGRNGIHFHSEYMGVVVLMLAGLGLGMLRGPRWRGFAAFWLGTMIVALLWALGGYTPFYHLVYAIIPGTKFFRAPSTMIFVVAFAVAVFAALGMERVIARAYGVRYLVIWLAAAGLTLVLAVSGALTTMAGTIADQGRYDAVLANQGTLALGAARSFVFVALAATTLFFLLRGRLQPLVAAVALIALASVDLWSVERLYWHFSPPAAVLYRSDATIDYVTAQKTLGRVLALPVTEAEAFHDPFLGPLGDGLMPHRIRTVLGYHGNELGRYDELLDKAGGYRQVVDPQMWRLLNVKYLLTNSAQIPLSDAKLLAGPTKDAAGSTVYLYSLPGDNPFAWVTPVIVKAPDEAVLTTVRDARFDVRLAALFDTSAAVQGKKLTALPAPIDVSAVARVYEPGHIVLEVSAPAPEGSALVVSENYYPGWRATVDGKPAAVGRTDFVLIGVALPTGGQRVELTFESPAFERGRLITLIALAVALAAVAGGVRLEQRADG
ncbi:MAG TPA: YfhO family protein [Gemmatimonadaceae bacterium]|nr:YfhO family protein [Gemmatimonadaceae bacterium]